MWSLRNVWSDGAEGCRTLLACRDTIRGALQTAPVGQRFVNPDKPLVIFAPNLGFGSAGALEKVLPRPR